MNDGSLSIEASLVFPIFILFIVMFIYVSIYVFKEELEKTNDNKNVIKLYEENENIILDDLMFEYSKKCVDEEKRIINID